MLYLFLDRGVSNSLDNNIPFFAEQGKMNIETSLDFFTADAKITGSKNHELYEEYKEIIEKVSVEDFIKRWKNSSEIANRIEMEKNSK
jgi:hypothetical protein